MTDVVARAVDALERQLFFADVNSRYGELRDDPDVWAEIEAERAVESGALPDASRSSSIAAISGPSRSVNLSVASRPDTVRRSSWRPTSGTTGRRA